MVEVGLSFGVKLSRSSSFESMSKLVAIGLDGAELTVYQDANSSQIQHPYSLILS